MKHALQTFLALTFLIAGLGLIGAQFIMLYAPGYAPLIAGWKRLIFGPLALLLFGMAYGVARPGKVGVFCSVALAIVLALDFIFNPHQKPPWLVPLCAILAWILHKRLFDPIPWFRGGSQRNRI